MTVSPQDPPPGPAAVPEPSDHSLLHRLRAGSQDAATQLYLRYARQLEQLARSRCPADLAPRLDAEDIVQSTFSSFFRGFNLGYYDVPAGETLWKLLLVIALNKIRAKCNFHHAARRDARLTTSVDAPETALPPGSSDETARIFLQMAIAQTLERLPESHQNMALLRIEGYEVAEIAARSGRSRRSVERVLQEFRQRLGDVLAQED
jgi:RNA polymerase sigma-70 factor (ECF subfamily)